MARVVLLCLTSVALAATATRRFDGEKVFRVNVQTDKEVEVLKNLSSVVMNEESRAQVWKEDS